MQPKKLILRLTKFLSRYGRYYFLGSLLLVIACFPVWQSPELTSEETAQQYNPYEQQFIEALEDTLQYLIDDSRVPGVGIAVVKDSTPILVKGYGLRNIKEEDSVDIHTVFRLASVSKGFASGLAATLVRDTLLAWSDPVIDYLPSFALISPEQTQEVTVKHVLSHTTGLPYHAYTNLVEAGQLRDDMIALLSGVNLIGKAGEWYSYQNVAYGIIEPVVEAATVESYQRLLQERILEPLQMSDASVWYQDMMETTNKALPHVPTGRGWATVPISENYYNVPSAGGVNASSLDMAQWLIALLGNRPHVLPSEVLDSLFTPQIKTPIENRYFSRWEQLEAAYYGLGWRIVHQAGDTVAFHGGYANGYRTAIALDRNKKVGICILANGSSSLVSRVVPLFLDLYRQHEADILTWEEQMSVEEISN
ncbi:serine hydrolase domain-containing protein [Tunicatimonas pelagia]|uniref:serine hydrolase domain-containing protein n=1 Tax=Tunicatimonas pelagia TaxID=931531 RepID=UPI002666855C|nr:serine hydrolase domain-containing protein [Tunicatimonas pelagia]WKN46200.1 serine hydrolase [Tunicatimonas pelagia]